MNPVLMQIPYRCRSCGKEAEVTVRTSRILYSRSRNMQPPEKKTYIAICPHCGVKNEIEVVEG
jgi:DNA-directed RNA polymerase subunit RPC12/RpoP